MFTKAVLVRAGRTALAAALAALLTFLASGAPLTSTSLKLVATAVLTAVATALLTALSPSTVETDPKP